MSTSTYNFGDYTAHMKICQGILTFPLLPCARPPPPRPLTSNMFHYALTEPNCAIKKKQQQQQKTKSTYKSQLANHCQSLSQFLQHEAARSISNPAGWDVNPTQVPFPQFVRFTQ